VNLTPLHYDNAMMESFFASLKQELTHHERFVDREQARRKVFEYIEQRLHSGLAYQSPAQFEAMTVT
jgi:putative transposase